MEGMRLTRAGYCFFFFFDCGFDFLFSPRCEQIRRANRGQLENGRRGGEKRGGEGGGCMRERERRREEEEDFSLTRDRKSFRRPGNRGEVCVRLCGWAVSGFLRFLQDSLGRDITRVEGHRGT